MATKAALANGEERPASGKLTPKRQGPNAEPNMLDKAVGQWKEFTHSRKEVEATTTVVLVAVFIFGLFFFVVDSVFAYGLDRLLKQLGGVQ
jgi:preprotein translocase SecE subunit